LRVAHGECAAGHALPAGKRVHPEGPIYSRIPRFSR
jgi:hypothetical protein